MKTKKFGERVYYFERVTSTMDIARELAEKDEPEGTVVVAETQTTGRGRFQREWYSPPGGVYFSLILRPAFLAENVPKINFLAAVAVAETLKELYRLNVKTKWPNDILVGEKKICGILTEAGMEGKKLKWVILGIGINANFEIKKLGKTIIPATSLKEELKKEVSLEELLQRLFERLESNYLRVKKEGFAWLLKRWKTFSDTLGRNVKVQTSEGIFLGKALDINSDGALVLRLSNGKKKKILAGDCYHLRKKGG